VAEYDCVWKLNGFLPAPPGGGTDNPEPSLFDVTGVLMPPFTTLLGEGNAEFMDPNLPGKTSASGDSESESQLMVECTVCGPPMIPKPEPDSSGVGVGGVGVRGGAGIGRQVAIESALPSRPYLGI
jgi:hypothetical protein